MKSSALLLLLALATATAPAQTTFVPKLADITAGKGWKGETANLKLTDKDGAPAIRFEKPVDGQPANIVWLDGLEFREGAIEFDGRGQSAPPQSNFVGIAFRVADARTHDVVYFRPFNFRSPNPDNKAHAVQYVSHPGWTWSKLRQERTGQFEKPIEPAPDGDAWFHARIEVAAKQVRVYVNGAREPSLVVPELSPRTGGSVGLWCQGVGTIANLRITSKN
jgi:hypothetical protein